MRVPKGRGPKVGATFHARMNAHRFERWTRVHQVLDRRQPGANLRHRDAGRANVAFGPHVQALFTKL